ncbi:MAG TPA: hypothetical protein PK129_14090 [Cellvibrionaceae bacterium]|nr:hypothetical protein [Cellvibrionaceae bacterium]
MKGTSHILWGCVIGISSSAEIKNTGYFKPSKRETFLTGLLESIYGVSDRLFIFIGGSVVINPAANITGLI